MAFDNDRNRVLPSQQRKVSRQVVITTRSRDYLVRQGL